MVDLIHLTLNLSVMIKLIVPLIFIIFISLSGCKTSSGSPENDLTTDTSTLLQTVTAEFSVNGMHCTGCENTIKTNVKELKGVKTIDASFKENKAVVIFDSLQTNEIAIMAAIEDAGYKVDTFLRK